MRNTRFVSTIIIVSLVVLALPTTVQAFPPLPSSFYGSVTLNDGDLPEGTLVEALIDGQVYATTNSLM